MKGKFCLQSQKEFNCTQTRKELIKTAVTTAAEEKERGRKKTKNIEQRNKEER